eukprot:2147315-Amphidinium_carterae.1
MQAVRKAGLAQVVLEWYLVINFAHGPWRSDSHGESVQQAAADYWSVIEAAPLEDPLLLLLFRDVCKFI